MSLALGQNESYINKIETGKTSTSISSFLNICDYLNISPSDFFAENLNNSENITEILSLFQQLTPNQAKYMHELLKDITKKTNIGS